MAKQIEPMETREALRELKELRQKAIAANLARVEKGESPKPETVRIVAALSVAIEKLMDAVYTGEKPTEPGGTQAALPLGASSSSTRSRSKARRPH